jgi:hypothetical protein
MPTTCVTRLNDGVVPASNRQSSRKQYGFSCLHEHFMNIWVDMEWTTLYLVARLLVTFLHGTSKGNPVRIRNCPAAVSRIEHPHVTGSLQNREDGSVETPVNV